MSTTKNTLSFKIIISVALVMVGVIVYGYYTNNYIFTEENTPLATWNEPGLVDTKQYQFYYSNELIFETAQEKDKVIRQVAESKKILAYINELLANNNATIEVVSKKEIMVVRRFQHPLSLENYIWIQFPDKTNVLLKIKTHTFYTPNHALLYYTGNIIGAIKAITPDILGQPVFYIKTAYLDPVFNDLGYTYTFYQSNKAFVFCIAVPMLVVFLIVKKDFLGMPEWMLEHYYREVATLTLNYFGDMFKVTAGVTQTVGEGVYTFIKGIWPF